jgi:hypothetical protein
LRWLANCVATPHLECHFRFGGLALEAFPAPAFAVLAPAKARGDHNLGPASAGFGWWHMRFSIGFDYFPALAGSYDSAGFGLSLALEIQGRQVEFERTQPNTLRSANRFGFELSLAAFRD